MSWTPQQKQNLMNILSMSETEVETLEQLADLAKELNSPYEPMGDNRKRVVVLTELLAELKPLIFIGKELEEYKTAVLSLYKKFKDEGRL